MQNQEFRFNEILFENRNKEYGAYALRNEADRILTKSLFIGVSLLAAVSITPMIISAFKTVEPIQSGGYELPPVMVIPDDPTVTPPPVTVVPPKPASVKTFDNRVPDPTANPTNEQVVKKIEGAMAGVKNNSDGIVAPPNIHVTTTPTIGTGPVINTVPPQVITQPVDKNKIVDPKDLAQEANFGGGLESFRNKVMNTFDGSGFESGDVMRTTITFIVEIDGTISGIKANGADADFNSEAIRTIRAISAKGKWTPGKNKQGEFVRSAFKFPITMKFDN